MYFHILKVRISLFSHVHRFSFFSITFLISSRNILCIFFSYISIKGRACDLLIPYFLIMSSNQNRQNEGRAGKNSGRADNNSGRAGKPDLSDPKRNRIHQSIGHFLGQRNEIRAERCSLEKQIEAQKKKLDDLFDQKKKLYAKEDRADNILGQFFSLKYEKNIDKVAERFSELGVCETSPFDDFVDGVLTAYDKNLIYKRNRDNSKISSSSDRKAASERASEAKKLSVSVKRNAKNSTRTVNTIKPSTSTTFSKKSDPTPGVDHALPPWDSDDEAAILEAASHQIDDRDDTTLLDALEEKRKNKHARKLALGYGSDEIDSDDTILRY